MKNKSILAKCVNSCKTSQELATCIYNELNKSKNYDSDLLEVYKDMDSKGLSTYELELLTGKRLELSHSGRYVLVQSKC
jgi:hypothetical protein